MARLIDLSHPIEAGMVTYPGLPGPTISDYLTRQASRSHYEEGTEFHIARIEMVANTGTYLDTPFHRYPNGVDLSELPVEQTALLPGACVRTFDAVIEPDTLDEVPIPGRAVLFNTGWDRHWRTEAYGAAGHPHLTEGTARLLVERGAALVGIDSVNIDDTSGDARPAHSLLLEAGIPIVEHLRGLDTLPETGFRFSAVPAAIRGMGTFPVRAFASIE